MRAVNLIPPEERRGDRAPLRTGPIVYVVVAAMAVALAAVTAVVLTGNQIADKKAEKASLEAQQAEAKAKAEALAPYSQFANMSDARAQTVSSLAKSRFDWERVMHELAIVIPDDVWLTEMTGTVSPETSIESGATVEGRDQVLGPALEMVGCGASQRAVARFLSALRDIDGVTRVGLGESTKPEGSTTSATSTDSAAGSSDECRTRDFIYKFSAIAAFDAVPTPPSTQAPAPDATATDTSTTETSTTDSTATTASTEAGGG
jgi:Tfp pilus assembly protein PilN